MDEVHPDISVIYGGVFGKPLMLPLHSSPIVYAARSGVFFSNESLLLVHEKHFFASSLVESHRIREKRRAVRDQVDSFLNGCPK